MKNRKKRKSNIHNVVFGTLIVSGLYISMTGFVISLKNNNLTWGQSVEQTWIAVLDVKNLATFLLILFMLLFVTALVTSPNDSPNELN